MMMPYSNQGDKMKCGDIHVCYENTFGTYGIYRERHPWSALTQDDDDEFSIYI